MNDFNSIDRLVEFGLGIAVARQMIRTMNQSFTNMVVPGAGNQPFINPKTYFAVIEGKQVGPLLVDELKKLIAENKMNGQSLIWTQGLPSWKFANEICEINKLLIEFPPEISL